MTPEEGAAWRIASFLGWKVLHSLFDDATCTSIQTFVDSVKSNPASLEKLTLPALSVKEQRKSVHQVIHKAFPECVSDTEGDCIVLYSCKNNSNRGAFRRT